MQPKLVVRNRPFNEPLSSEETCNIQLRRATEHGRGRRAKHPLEIPWTGWKDILWRTYAEFFSDRLASIAGGVAFFALFAVFPAMTALISAYGLFFHASTIAQSLSMLNGVVPNDVLNLLRQQAVRIASQSHGALTLGVAVGILTMLWSAMSGVKAMIDALNVIYEEQEARSLFRFNLVALLFTLGSFLVILLAMGAVVAVPLMLSWLGLGGMVAFLLRVVRWPALLMVLLIGLAILYRYGPDRRPARWRWVSVGSVLASLMWIGASYLFSWYLGRFNSYNATYGSLGAVVAMMMWLWISA
ncbi:MAG TPA: YihY/virulence factor BrkB family protein, partial [Xanthobacteraceae bacterium]|nr:YihY/virulence factor BrkB family protein [Xanthobacteraceae bacterium]